MNLIIGGAYQGKLAYAMEKYELKDTDIYECSAETGELTEVRCYDHYENYLMYCFRNNCDPISEFPADRIIILNDIFCGVVPVDADIRAFREYCGRAAGALTRKASTVTRLFCGLPQVLKADIQKIILIRHGKTQASVDHVYCGKTDQPLNESGIQEIENKKQLGIYPDAAGFKMYSSALTRTKETLELIYKGREYEAAEDLNETDFGDFEMRAYAGDLESDPDFIIWTGGDNESNVCPHGESSRIMTRRVLKAFKKIVDEGKDAVIVAHGGPITAVFQNLFPDSGLNMYQIQPKNGEGYVIEFQNGRAVKYEKITEQA